MGNKWCKLPQYDNAEHRCPLAQRLQDIHDIAIDYDGYTTVEGFKAVIDDIKAIAISAVNEYKGASQ